jgi:hypothetical protein
VSKVLPEVVNLILEGRVFLFQFFDHDYRFVLVRNGRRMSSAPSEIIAHR